MAIKDYTKFKGVANIGSNLVMNQLEYNMKSLIDWAMLGIGGWINVIIPTSGIVGGTFSKLYPTKDQSYSDGQIWQTIRKDWVWETGVSYSGGSPIAISGIYINNQFTLPNSVTHGYYLDYPNGRVVFNSPLPTGSSVAMNYSYRYTQVYLADDVPWWPDAQYRSERPDDIQWGLFADGDWSLEAARRIQLPAIIIEAVPKRSDKGWEMGNGSLIIEQDILFHVLGEKRWDRNQLLDILDLQHDKVFALYDVNQVNLLQKYPLNYQGTLVANPTMYPTLVDSYRWNECRFKNVRLSDIVTQSPYLYGGVARVTTELIFNSI